MLGVGLGESFLQLRDGMWFRRNEVFDNAILCIFQQKPDKYRDLLQQCSKRGTRHFMTYKNSTTTASQSAWS